MGMNSIVRDVKFGLKKHSPEIMVVSGVAGMVISGILACKATTKISTILDEHRDTMESIREMGTDDPEVYSEEDKRKDTTIVYAQTGFKLLKLYGPAISIGVASITSILVGHNILRKRNLALAAAYTVMDNSFREYRKRVVDRFGEEVDYQLKNNIKAQEIETVETDEKGKEKKVKKTVEVADPDVSGYMKYFTRTNPNWENNEDYILTFLRQQQSYANDKLKAEGHLTLNAVYDMIGFHDTKAGMVVGWIYDKKTPTGDNYVEFNVKHVYLPDENGELDDAYAIDFNVDGNIYNYMA